MRIWIFNIEADKEECITIAYVPSVATEKGRGGAERSRQRRVGVLQRALYLALRDRISAISLDDAAEQHQLADTWPPAPLRPDLTDRTTGTPALRDVAHIATWPP